MRSGECDVTSLYVLCGICLLYVACLTVFVNCLMKQFAIRLGVFAILLLNVMDLFSVDGGDPFDKPSWIYCHLISIL